MQRKHSVTLPSLKLLSPVPLSHLIVDPYAHSRLVRIKVPFSVKNLQSWKELLGAYREDPDKVPKVMEAVTGTQDPD